MAMTFSVVWISVRSPPSIQISNVSVDAKIVESVQPTVMAPFATVPGLSPVLISHVSWWFFPKVALNS
jgi:hypothetical protein